MSDLRWVQTDDVSKSKPVVLLSNPLGASLEVWDPVMAGLSSVFRVVRYDSPGHGGSSLRDDMDIGALTDVAIEVLDAADADRAHFVGLSLGGMIAISAAAAHPSRVMTASIVCSSAHFEDKLLWSSRAAEARAGGLDGLAGPSLDRWFTTEWVESQADAAEAARRLFLGTTPEGYARTAEAIGRMDLRDALSMVWCPALVVAGRSDPSTPPPMLRAIAEGVRDATYREIDGAHWLPVERPAAVTTVLTEFIEAHDPRTRI